mgnify:CR=1 FL=1
MIIKTFELEKLRKNKSTFILLYGQNEGFKNQVIKDFLSDGLEKNITKYEENEVINSYDNFINQIKNKSFFDDKKIIIISRSTEKIFKTIENLLDDDYEDTKIIINAGILEKKSKLRNNFEKNKKLVCIPVYPDNDLSLSKIAGTFFKKKQIPISQEMINLLVERCRGDRENLNNELEKIESFSKNKKKILIEDIFKLSNLAENYSYSELCDQCLMKNLKKINNILNENNYDNQDCVAITRTMILKVKRLVKLKEENLYEKNIDNIITNFKPPIFWKEKEVVKTQMKNWSLESAKKLLYELNDLELLIKKNLDNSLNILQDFIISKAKVSN